MICPLCAAKTNKPICAKCLRGVLMDLNELAHLLTRLESVARREEHVGGRSEGPSHPAFAPTLLDLSAADLLTEATDTLWDIAAKSGIWQHGRTWRTLLKSLITRKNQLANNPHIRGDRERITRMVDRVRFKLTPPSERIIIGSCLNPVCKRELSITRGQVEAYCSGCGSTWQVDAVRAARLANLEEKTFEGTPAQAARHIYKKTHLYVSRKVVTMWIQRGSLPRTMRLTEGSYQFDLRDLVERAELMNPNHR